MRVIRRQNLQFRCGGTIDNHRLLRPDEPIDLVHPLSTAIEKNQSGNLRTTKKNLRGLPPYAWRHSRSPRALGPHRERSRTGLRLSRSRLQSDAAARGARGAAMSASGRRRPIGHCVRTSRRRRRCPQTEKGPFFNCLRDGSRITRASRSRYVISESIPAIPQRVFLQEREDRVRTGDLQTIRRFRV